MIPCPWLVIVFYTSDPISGMLEKLFCPTLLEVLETSLKNLSSVRLSEKDRVAMAKAIETAKVKETIKQAQFHNPLGKAEKFCWHS